MHAIYHFLLDEPLEEYETDKELLDSVDGAFQALYAERFCDENNWYGLLDLTTKDGRHLVYPDQSQHYSGQQPISWEQSVRIALDCVAYDLHLFNVVGISVGRDVEEGAKTIQKLSNDALIAEIHEQVPRALADLYHSKAEGKRVIDHGSQNYEDYSRFKLAKGYEYFVRAKFKPFSTYLDEPYDYRAYDLTEGDPGAATVILRVDIHT